MIRPSLSPAEVQRYRAQGYLTGLRVLPAAAAAGWAARIEAHVAGDPRRLRDLRTKAHIALPALAELARLPAILDRVERLIGPNILLRATSLFAKPAGSPDHVSWHQDALYWGLEPAEVVTAWLALTDSTAEMGALQVLPRSHLGALLPHAPRDAGGNLLRRAQTIVAPLDPAAIRTLELAAGEMSLHHVRLAHGSGPNRAVRPRIGLAIRYMPTYVRNVTGEPRHALLLRGEDRFHHFLPEPASWSYPPP
jgi:non-heme Fe2+,alpha-ketoglutarate-dependent halogenase